MYQAIWYIRSSAELGSLHDEFIEGPFRLLLGGTCLTIRIEGCTPDDLLRAQATTLARRYVATLGQILPSTLSLLTEEEFASLPPWAAQNQAMQGTLQTWVRDSELAVRQARHALTSYGWPLKACYDYMQDASADSGQFLPTIYKMVETMSDYLGGEAELIKRTQLGAEVKRLGRLANEDNRDERHAPKRGSRPNPVTGEELGDACAAAAALLRKFEDLCRADGRAG
jgi:hypothetical protein